jgi:hypothetical protein
MDYVMRIAEIIYSIMPFLSLSLAHSIDKDIEIHEYIEQYGCLEVIVQQ